MPYVYPPIRQWANTYNLPQDGDKNRKTTFSPGFEGALNRTEYLYAATSEMLTIAQLKLVAGADLFTGAVRPVKNGAGNPMGRYVFIAGLSTPVQTGVDTLAIQDAAATGWWLHEDLGSRVTIVRKRVMVDAFQAMTPFLDSEFVTGRPFQRNSRLIQPGNAYGLTFSESGASIGQYRAEWQIGLPTGNIAGVYAVISQFPSAFVGGDTLGRAMAWELIEHIDSGGPTIDAMACAAVPLVDVSVASGGVGNNGYVAQMNTVYTASMGTAGLATNLAPQTYLATAHTYGHMMLCGCSDTYYNVTATPPACSSKNLYSLRWTPHYTVNGATIKSVSPTLHHLEVLVDAIEVVL